MSKINDGGPAFPASVSMIGDREGSAVMDSVNRGLGGMSLRDWFAGQALTDQQMSMLADAYCAKMGGNTVSPQTLRYFHADAMLAARAEGGAS